ncbi:MAG: electron transport complex protein RnfC [Firmicutes bacterium HGW-Firmicutes-7]|nr:MAG: electron transport complex protein RnfC [Firmicutes bacterium HGW-Firmicutes-7]
MGSTLNKPEVRKVDNFINMIKDSGVVGAGGAGFPTHVKFDTKADFVIVNGAECEPLLRVDQILMDIEADKILFALDQCVKHVGAKEGIIGLKNKYAKAISSLTKALEKYPNLRIHLLDNVYPAGDEQYLVYVVTGRIVPEGGIPIMVGTIVTNVETLLNIYNGIHNIPVTEKYLTIAGAVKNPITIKVPLGISVREVIHLAGGPVYEKYKVIDGGPMMGKILESIDDPVKKTSKGYIVLPETHPLIKNKEKKVSRVLKEAQTACCHCDLCTDVCPRYLLGHKLHPSKLMRISSYGSLGDGNATLDEAFLCCECGLCEQACIMNLQPWKVNINIKKQLTEMGIKNQNNRKPTEVNPFFKYRGFPVKKLIYRIELDQYDVQAPLTETDVIFKEVTIVNKQHIGAPSVLWVKEGEMVTKGQLIFRAKDHALGANIHSSISGIVLKACDGKVIIKCT